MPKLLYIILIIISSIGVLWVFSFGLNGIRFSHRQRQDIPIGRRSRNDQISLASQSDTKNAENYKDLDPGNTSGLHKGDPSKLRNILVKALRGEPIRVVIIGGSNSAGGGMDKNTHKMNKRYFRLFVDWWNNIVAAQTGSQMSEDLIAIGGTGSYFFAYCYDTFLANPKQIDIAIVEAAVNYNTAGKAEPLEQLTRVLYNHPSQPAIWYVNLVSRLGKDPKTKKVMNPECVNLEDFGLYDVAAQYGVTSFSMKDFVCPTVDGKPRFDESQKGYVSTDQHHVGEKTHAQIAFLMTNYVKSVLDDVTKQGANMAQSYPTKALSLFVKEETKLLVNPQCWSSITPYSETGINKPTLSVKVLTKTRFKFYANGYEGNPKQSPRKDRQSGWANTASGGRVVFQINVKPWNSATDKRRSVIALIHNVYNGGDAKIWVDNSESDAINIVNKAQPGGSNELYTIADRVEPGIHTLSIVTKGKGMFIISGILVGPPEFSRRKVT
ncbi:uncharacterized protein LOC5513981 [Nematostella vectensis]|uniref:uncharacterized protein LOC5513981 n=1 Tax=Nematostella vectensis TaxID=45351 RepID=UPI002077725E|nr:uncharacterized protein LOC5513981 [Nematostella vectensis]